MPIALPKQLFGLPLRVDASSSIENMLPRAISDDFELRDAALGNSAEGRFIIALAASPKSARRARALVTAVKKHSETPVAIFLDRTDAKMRESLARGGIPFISADGNAYLPFAGILATNSPALREPKTLSPQAQRIFLNLLSGRWDKCTASDLAGLCQKSNASITRYLAEIEAVMPSLVTSSWRAKVLQNPGIPNDELLERFEPYLATPVAERVRLVESLGLALLARHGACLSGESALAFFSDLAYNPERLTVAMGRDQLKKLRAALGSDWNEAPWHVDATITIEVLAYPLDERATVSRPSTGLECVDPSTLYAEFLHTHLDDPRLLDAIEQLRRTICR